MLLRKESLVIAVDGTRMSLFQNIGEAFEPELKLVEEYRNPPTRHRNWEPTDQDGPSRASPRAAAPMSRRISSNRKRIIS